MEVTEHVFGMIVCVKTVVQVKLLPTPRQESALAATLHACNEAAGFVSRIAFERNVMSRNELQKLSYREIKDQFGLSAQPAVRVVKKVVDAYTALRANIRAGNLGGERSRRRIKAESKPIAFRGQAAQPFDDRCLSWQLDARTVSIWTTAGRLKNIPFTGSPSQLQTLREHRRGESDLMFRDGRWFLVATCEIPEKPQFEPVDWLGVDRGITNLATTSDLDNFQGRRLQRYRRWHARKRTELQVRRTKSATRRLKRRTRREARHRPGRTPRHPRPGTAAPAPASHTVLVAVPPARTTHHLQGPPGGCTGAVGGRPLHLADVPEVQAHVLFQPVHQGLVLLPPVWSRWTRRRRRRCEHP